MITLVSFDQLLKRMLFLSLIPFLCSGKIFAKFLVMVQFRPVYFVKEQGDLSFYLNGQIK